MMSRVMTWHIFIYQNYQGSSRITPAPRGIAILRLGRGAGITGQSLKSARYERATALQEPDGGVFYKSSTLSPHGLPGVNPDYH